MNLEAAVIEMPKEEAEKAWRDYNAALKRRHHTEDAAIAQGYKALSEGKKLINLSQVIKEGGEFETDRLPRLAIAPANAPWITVFRNTDGSLIFRTSSRSTKTVNCSSDTLPRCGWQEIKSWNKRAMVPIVPPHLRPARSTTLSTYHVLWEVPKWEQAPRPPGDPALLKHLGGDLWIVLAEWNLTPLEQAVLAGRI